MSAPLDKLEQSVSAASQTLSDLADDIDAFERVFVRWRLIAIVEAIVIVVLAARVLASWGCS